MELRRDHANKNLLKTPALLFLVAYSILKIEK